MAEGRWSSSYEAALLKGGQFYYVVGIPNSSVWLRIESITWRRVMGKDLTAEAGAEGIGSDESA